MNPRAAVPRPRRWGLASALLALLALSPLPAAALSVVVEVQGVTGEEQKNVLALLGIYQERADKDLTVPRLLALHRRAPEQIEQALAPFGRYRVQVQDSLQEPATPGGTWVARYRIDPGPAVKIGRVDYQVTGPGADNPRFPKQFPMKTGEVLLHSAYEKAKGEIVRVASEEGYLDADLVRHQVLIDPVSYQATIDFHIDTGPRYYIGKVRFEQDLLADDYLQTYVDFKPGTLYDPDLLLGLQARLLGTEYFDEVEIVPRKDLAGPDRVIPIDVIAHRNKANKYRVGLGFGTDVGPRFILEYQRRYLGPNGHKLKTEIQIAQPVQSFTAEYRIPFRNPVQDYILFRPEYHAFDTATLKGDLVKVSAAHSIVTPAGWRRNIGIDYRYEDSKIAFTGPSSFNGLVPNVSWGMVVADDPINTRKGHRIKFILQGTAETILSETTWLSGTVSYKQVMGLGQRLRLITRADLGATLAGSLEDVPGSERFFAGGDQSIRGWGLDVLGPEDPDTGVNVGGRYLAVGSLELERRIQGNWGGVVFTDFGNAFDPDYEQRWEQSAGLGLRYATPIGPVRIDVAYAMTKDFPGFRLHIGLGPDL